MTEALKPIFAWHFLPANGRTRFNDLPVEPGRPLLHKGKLQLCNAGFHASRSLRDALSYAPGPILCRVRCEKTRLEANDKLVCAQRTALWLFDASSALRLFACRCVRETPLADGRTVWDLLTDPHSRQAVEVAERFARSEATKEELSKARRAANAAYAAAYAAAYVAAAAAANDAATISAYAATISAYAATTSAYAAANAAAYDAYAAANAAAYYAAVAAAAAARNFQAELLENMVLTEAKRLGIWAEDR